MNEECEVRGGVAFLLGWAFATCHTAEEYDEFVANLIAVLDPKASRRGMEAGRSQREGSS